ncbi:MULTISPECIES: radical SAM protein [unclassified Streptomyces]|uniref:radical SAM protein n=1 Tax=unclassified Streptomyces TaxID=2593676 RepID=UPI002366F844|nr:MULTISPECIES: radical SAM protein [unclassified Streptomyces]MDF3139845.1 radical SAM protein [Streptomyces sp. T21Q-yed]WDF41903.1 radical SAM protein [Streptomyces sp. T12]
MRIAVSYYCNLRCQHCYVPELNRTKYRTLLESSQLTLEEITSFIDRLVDEMELQKVTITGGEALLHPVWPRTKVVLRHALDRGLTVQLNTSGSGQVRMAQIAEVCGADLDQLILHLSLDGVDEERVDAFRGRKGAMRDALRSLRDARDIGMAVEARYTITEENQQDTVPTYQLVSEYNARSFLAKPMFAAGVARDNEALLLRKKNQVRDVQLALLDRSIGNTTRLGLPEPVYVLEEDFPAGHSAYVIKCACGDAAGYLSTNGDIYPCSYLVGAPDDRQHVLGNIRDADFVEMWSDPLAYSEFRSAAKDQNCTAQNIVSAGMGVETSATKGCSCGGSQSECACG